MYAPFIHMYIFSCTLIFVGLIFSFPPSGMCGLGDEVLKEEKRPELSI